MTNYDEVLKTFHRQQGVFIRSEEGIGVIELGKKDDGVAQFRHVIERYPRSNEALQAKDRLRKLAFDDRRHARPASRWFGDFRLTIDN